MEIELPDKQYFSIGEVAKAFQINTSKIRFWENEFPQLSPKKNKKGTRKYSQKDVKILQLIYHLVEEEGYTLEGARSHLKGDLDASLTNFDIVEKLKNIRNFLQELKKEL